VQLFQGVSHGFAVKGDPEDPYQRRSFASSSEGPARLTLTSRTGWCKEQSLRGIIDWFDLWLAK